MVTLTITNYRDLFTNIRKRPGVWLIREDFATVVAFVEGCDEANVRSLLIGFQPWLVTQAGCLDSHVWWSIVAHLTEPAGAKKFRDMDADSTPARWRRCSTCSTSSWSSATSTTT
jgi:hypothetical protein